MPEVGEQEHAAGAQHAGRLGEEPRHVGVAVRRLDAEHGVERRGGERQALGVPGDEREARRRVLGAAARDRGLREIEARHAPRAEPLEHERGAPAAAAADLEHVAARELRRAGDVRVEAAPKWSGSAEGRSPGTA